MKSIANVSLFALFVCVPCAAGAGAAPDALWQKAVAIAGANGNWTAGLVVARSEERDDDGKVTKTQEQWLRTTPGEDGKETFEVVKALEDGKELMDRELAKLNKRVKSQRKEGSEKGQVNLSYSPLGPFDPEAQASVSAQYRGPREIAPGETCAAYEFEQKRKEDVVKGTACLAEQTGVPVEISISMDPLPQFVRQLKATIRYESDSDGAWYPKEQVMDIAARFLFIKKNIHSFTTFGEYRKKTEK